MGHSGWVSGVGFVCSNRLILQMAAVKKRNLTHFLHWDICSGFFVLEIVGSQRYNPNLKAFTVLILELNYHFIVVTMSMSYMLCINCDLGVQAGITGGRKKI